MRRALASVLVLAGLLTLVVATGSNALRAKDRPDLRIAKGSVVAADGAISGSFVVRNAGQARAKKSRAQLSVQAPGDDPVIGAFKVPALGSKSTQSVDVAAAVPAGLPDGALAIVACLDVKGKVKESKEANNCGAVGSIQIGAGGGSLPPNPVAFTADTVFTLNSSESRYWVYVPGSYDEAHNNPTTMFVWMHGCGGAAEGDIYTISPGGDQNWISVALGGREGDCWDPVGDQPKIFAAIADMKSHFNVDPRRVILGGFSSGGHIAYRTAFYNANSFAGVLAADTLPFEGTGSTPQESIAAAAWKFNVVHLAHLQDEVYAIDDVRAETEAMRSAGFPVERIERVGTHYNGPGENVNGQQVPGTDADIQTYLLSRLDDGWQAPAP